GEMQCASTKNVEGSDRSGNPRKTIMFELVRLKAIPDSPATVSDVNRKSIYELRDAAYSRVEEPSAKKTGVRTLYERSCDVAIYVLARAKGQCESCGVPAPFLRPDESPYLEVHHIDRLSDGGLDVPSRVAAICPTCHRHIHCGKGG